MKKVFIYISFLLVGCGQQCDMYSYDLYQEVLPNEIINVDEYYYIDVTVNHKMKRYKKPKHNKHY